MLTVIYDPINGPAFPDLKVMEHASNIIALYKEGTVTVCPVGTDALVQAFRVQVARGNINHNELEFQYGGASISVDSCGMLKCWPSGFCDEYENMLMELLDRKYEQDTK